MVGEYKRTRIMTVQELYDQLAKQINEGNGNNKVYYDAEFATITEPYDVWHDEDIDAVVIK